MKLTAILLTVFCLQVSAKVFSQEITLNEKNAPLEKVMRSIRQQSGYGFIFDLNQLKKAKPVTVNLQSKSLNESLEIIFENQPFVYEVKDKVIIIKPKKTQPDSKEQQQVIKGKVVGENREPLTGATVQVQGTKITVTTSEDGSFNIVSQLAEGVLTISYIGYATEQVKFDKNNFGPFTIVLKAALSSLDEVEINTGYYKVKDRERTGSIVRIDAKTIAMQPISNPLQALQGRVAGLEITQLTGVPGGGFSVRVRGQNSINSGADPLYIVDGISFPSTQLNSVNSNVITKGVNPLSMINPGDIQSIEVLKDADATAIYGSRGGNGVILITTKKGIQQSTTINANISRGFSEVGHQMDLMNTEQYIAMRMEALKNDGLSPGPNDVDVNGTWDQNKYTDWQDMFIGGTAKTTNATLGISGGSSIFNYLLSGNYYQEGTVFPGNFGFSRGGLHSNMSLGTAASRLKLEFTTNYSYAQSNLLETDLTTAISRAPNAPDLYDQYGQLNWYYNNQPIQVNPLSALLQTQDANTHNLVASAKVSFKIVNNLTLNTNLGYNLIKREELFKRPNAARNPASNPISTNRSAQFGNTSNTSWIAEPQLNYQLKTAKGMFSALIGMSFQATNAQFRTIVASNFNSDELLSDISSASAFAVGQNTFTDYKYASAYSRLNYSHADRYFLNLTGRREASSKFGPGNQFANFGAVGVAWIFSEETFLKESLPFISFGKLRASYGVTGNDQIADYQFLQLYASAASYMGIPTLSRSRISNADYAWETSKKLEAALQLGFLEDRVNLQFGYFNSRSSNQLSNLTLPPSVGSDFILGNLPAIVSNTGLEMEGSFQIIQRKNLNWTSSFNITLPKNRLVAFPNLATSGSSTRYIIGEPLNIVRYYDTTIDKQTGTYTAVDIDNNGLRNDADRYLNQFLGQACYGGLGNSVTYKNFSFDFLFSFIKQNRRSLLGGYFSAPGTFSITDPNSNRPSIFLNRWQNDQDEARTTKFTSTSVGSTNYRLGATTNGKQGYEDGSFIRLKNVALSYQLPEPLISKLKLKNLSIKLQGQNLFTITQYEGLDPETAVVFGLPPLRTFLIGLQVNL